MATPFTFEGKLHLPGTPGLASDPIPVNFSGSYDKKSEQEWPFAGVGSFVLPLGSIVTPGAKLVLLIHDAPAAPAVGAALQVTFDNGDVPIEMSPGGAHILWNPSPTAGITSVSVAHTSSGKLRAWVLA